MAIWDWIDDWYRIYNPQGANPEDVESGKRAPLISSGYVKYPGGVTQKVQPGNLQTGACQYWINGLSPPCKLWNADLMRCNFSAEGDKPSGYGIGFCDMLGRREWCTHYEKSKDYDSTEFACVVPCVERSGLGRQVQTEGTLSFRPIFPAEVKGYNADEDGVGRCDGIGLGRGDKGPFELVEEAWKHPQVCRFYRPQLMGFGAYQPRPYHGSTEPGVPFDEKRNWVPSTIAELHDGTAADPLSYMNPRLPFAFQIYNNRAMFQICAHWESNRPSFFRLDTWGDSNTDFDISLDEGVLCGCSDSACNPFKNMIEDWNPLLPPMLQNVWAAYGGIVCNGAKPECPCYSGQWVYCTDANIKDGMRISANQILELRFWESNWTTQDEYNEYYQEKPGPTQNGYADETTASIYTFTEWLKIDTDNPDKNIMKGHKVWLCQPSPLHMREFVPEQYVTKDPITYPTMEGYVGTNIRGEGVLFPTLVRTLKPPSDYVPDISILYPYNVKDPWGSVVCSQDEPQDICVHDFNLTSTPFISVVGYGAKEAEIYVINDNLSPNITDAISYMTSFQRASQIPANRRDDYNRTLAEAVQTCIDADKGISLGITTLTGFFHLDNVELELNKTNNLYVLCKYNELSGDYDEAFTFRRLQVESRYWGALITQTSASHSPSGEVWDNPFPKYYDPAIVINGDVHTTLGDVASVFSVYSLYVHSPLGEDTAYYSYFINQVEEEVESVEKWAQVGPTGYIWAEIDNLDICYDQDFTVTEAKMIYTVTADDDGNRVLLGMCGNDPDAPIDLEVIYPSEGTSKYKYRRTIPPNAVLLKAPQPLPFFNDKWNLSIKYTVNMLDTQKGDNVVWPTGLDGPNSRNKSAFSPFAVQHVFGDSTFSVPGVGSLTKRGTVKVMAEIVDENVRVQATAATKMIMQGHHVGCRSVDIFYSYAGDATAYDLEPKSGFFTWSGAPSVNESSSKGVRHGKTTPCGDHLCGALCPPGHSWFPFNFCTALDFYNVLNGAAQCTMRVSEVDEALKAMGEGAHRYGLAPEYQASVSPGGNWASACGTSFYYHYSHAPIDSMQFTGNGYRRAKINKWYYLFREWALPPFGNTGRGYVERFLTRDFNSHVDKSGPKHKTSFTYMPMVFDVEDLTQQTLNCFEIPDNYTPLSEPFSCFPMLSNYLFTNLSEHIDDDRYRFEDILQVIYHGNCMYPYPILRSSGVQRYGFLNENHVYAWPEYWKPIERNISSTHGRFDFVMLDQQAYFFDFIKDEHRFITDEGTHTLIFTPPTGPEGEGEGNTKTKAYPSVSLNGEYPRYFQIIYENYDSRQVDWQDESETGEENSSGGTHGEDDDGEGGDSSKNQIYEQANNGPNQGINGGWGDGDVNWIHDFNTLFNPAASPDPVDDRKAYMFDDLFDGPVYGNYNRGVIATIARNRLYYLPMSKSDAGSASEEHEKENQGLYVWSVGVFGVAPVEIHITGQWGVDKTASEGEEEVYSKPGISVRESTEAVEYEENGWPVWTNGEHVASVSPEYGFTQEGMVQYNVTLMLPRRPERLSRTLNHFMVSVTSYGDEKLYVNTITADLGQYVRAEETIKVWERRYKVGIATLPEKTINADGPNTKKFRDYQRDNENAGQYFPFNERIEEVDDQLDRAGHIISKLNMVGVTEVVTEDEELDISMGNLQTVEREEQAKLYEEAFGLDDYDEISYAGILPPAVEGWLEQINISLNGQATSLKLEHRKSEWDQHSVKNALRQEASFWQPGGHFFAWSESMFRARCYVFGPVQEVYSVVFVHHKHGGSSATLEAGQSYAGWGRLWYYEGKLKNMQATGQTQEYATTDSLTGAKNQVYRESR